MIENLNSVMIYLIIAILIAGWPFLAIIFREQLNRVFDRVGRAFLFELYSPLYSHLLGGGVGIAAGVTLLWWKTGDQHLSPLDVGTSIVVSVLALALFRWQRRPTKASRFVERSALALAILLALYLSFGAGIFSKPFVALTAWHHWSAYIGPSELMRAGGRILYDFPAQYGLGPTALLAATCFGSCWLAMYYVAAAITCMFFFIVLYCAMYTRLQGTGGRVAVIIAAVAVCFFWSAYPPLVSTPRMVPSVQGLRFFPAFLLVVVQLAVDQMPRLSRYWAVCGHACYALGMLWSPEAFFMVGFIWAPYYSLRIFREAPAASRLSSVMKSIGTIALLTFAIVLSFVSIYWAIYGVTPSFGAYLIYIMYPPGPLPIDPLGPVWFAAISVSIGVIVLTRALLSGEDMRVQRRLMLLLFLSYATLIYCMGRGHSNNFLNVLPATFLVLLCGIEQRVPLALRTCATTMIICLIVFLSMFGWTLWRSTVQQGMALQFEPRSVLSLWNYDNQNLAEELKLVFGTEGGQESFANLSSALSDIRKISREPILIMDQYYLLPVDNSGPWSAFNGNGNYVFMPIKWREEFLLKSSASIAKDGWLIVENSYSSEWLTSLEKTYKRGVEKVYGNYVAIRYTTLSTEDDAIVNLDVHSE